METLRTQLDCVLQQQKRAPVSHTEWLALEREYYACEYETADSDSERRDTLERALRRVLELRKVSEPPYDSVGHALVGLQAADLLETPAVAGALEQFRERYLPDGLIPSNAIPEWLRAHQRDGEPRPEVVLRLRSGQGVLHAWQHQQPITIAPDAVIALGGRCDSLHFRGKVYAITRDGALAQLKSLVELVQAYTLWSETQCIEYILSGILPDSLAIEYTIHKTFPANIPVATLRVPLFYTAEVVSDLYRCLQQSVYARKKRVRKVQFQHAALVRFVEVFRAQQPEANFEVITAAWNAHCVALGFPEWQETVQSLQSHYNEYIKRIQSFGGSEAGE